MKIRNATAADAAPAARMHVETWQSAFRGMMSDEHLDTLDVNEFERNWKRAIESLKENRLRVVVEIDGKIVGFIAAGPARWELEGYPEELYAMYVHPSQQKKGIGKKLLEYYKDWLRSRNQSSFALWVLKDNRASRAFYEAVGGIDLKKEKADRAFGGTHLIEVAYGWSLE